MRLVPQGTNNKTRATECQHEQFICFIMDINPTIDAITKISRQISAVLDVEDPISGRYDLEVSSPGLDRPLYQLAHYQRFVDEKIKLRLRVPKGDDNRRNYTGHLQSVQDGKIVLTLDDESQVTFDFDEIEKGNLVPEFKK